MDSSYYGPYGKQVTTELDFAIAIFDYLAEQLDGRFRLQFPNHHDVLNTMVGNLRNPLLREDAIDMYAFLMHSGSQFTEALNSCMVIGCPSDANHVFLREALNLLWDSRENTREWLKEQGIVPGQSAN